MKTVGILGGMGPYATLFFYKMLLDLTPAKKDWDHLHVVIDSNPHIPSRSRHHLYNECSPVQGMVESCQRLEQYPVDFIVIPCNSACAYLPEVRKGIYIPVLNIMEVTVDSLAKRFPDAKNVAVLGGVVTYDRETYRPFLEKHGLNYIKHSSELQRSVEYLIELIKANKRKEVIEEVFRIIMEQLQAADVVIMGCTELNEVMRFSYPYHCIDSSTELAIRTIEYARER